MKISEDIHRHGNKFAQWMREKNYAEGTIADYARLVKSIIARQIQDIPISESLNLRSINAVTCYKSWCAEINAAPIIETAVQFSVPIEVCAAIAAVVDTGRGGAGRWSFSYPVASRLTWRHVRALADGYGLRHPDLPEGQEALKPLARHHGEALIAWGTDEGRVTRTPEEAREFPRPLIVAAPGSETPMDEKTMKNCVKRALLHTA